MLTKDLVLKIGFTRQFRQFEYLPCGITDDILDDNIYWFAPGTLRAMEFTTMSDVWAFGSTLWEIFSRGAIPYQQYTTWEGEKG